MLDKLRRLCSLIELQRPRGAAMAIRTRILTIFAAAALAACTAPTAATSRGGAPMKAATVASGSIASESSDAAPPALDDGCTFSLGTTTCVSTAQHEETS